MIPVPGQVKGRGDAPIHMPDGLASAGKVHFFRGSAVAVPLVACQDPEGDARPGGGDRGGDVAVTIPWWGLALFGLTTAGCHRPDAGVPSLPAVVLPPRVNRDASSLEASVPPASPSLTPPVPAIAPFRQVPFAFVLPGASHLAVFDLPSHDVYLYPGAGTDVANVSRLDAGMWAYDDGRDVSVYDAHREERVVIVHGEEVGGFAFYPGYASREVLYFLGQSDPVLAARGIGWLYCKQERAIPSTGSVPVRLSPGLAAPRWVAPVNAVAARFGGLTSVSVDERNSVVVFTTATGRVATYTPATRTVTSRPNFSEEPGDQHATQASIDPVWGRFCAWHDTARKSLLVFDRWQARLDTVPYVRLGPGIATTSAPAFLEQDPLDVVFTVTRLDGTTRLMAYHLEDETVRSLAVLGGFQQWARPRLPPPL
ncbi:MAG: hypothetical protein VKP72_14365 [bacterium]|nr:hypothetical protein [bacterium]